MESSFFNILLVLGTLASLKVSVEAQAQSCLSITSCLGSDFDNMIKRKKTEGVCRTLQEALDCIIPKVKECEKSLEENGQTALAGMFTRQKDKVQNIYTQRCQSVGPTEGDENDKEADKEGDKEDKQEVTGGKGMSNKGQKAKTINQDTDNDNDGNGAGALSPMSMMMMVATIALLTACFHN